MGTTFVKPDTADPGYGHAGSPSHLRAENSVICNTVDAARHIVGPNAIIQTGEAIAEVHGEAMRKELFRAAGLQHHLDHPPDEMVSSLAVNRLNRTVMNGFPRPSGSCAWQVRKPATTFWQIAFHPLPENC